MPIPDDPKYWLHSPSDALLTEDNKDLYRRLQQIGSEAWSLTTPQAFREPLTWSELHAKVHGLMWALTFIEQEIRPHHEAQQLEEQRAFFDKLVNTEQVDLGL